MALYLSVGLGFYKPYVRKYSLTDDAIKKLDKDITNGKKIDTKNYIIEDSNYNNILSYSALSISNFIGSTFRSVLNKLLKDASSISWLYLI